MTKLISLIIISLITLNASAGMNEIKGKLTTSKKTKEISLFTIQEGELVLYATTLLGKDGSFGFLFNAPYEGFYVVTDSKFQSPSVPLYINSGDKAEISINNMSVEFPGENTEENKVIAEWMKLSESVRIKSVYFRETRSTYKDFFPEFTEFTPKAEAFANSINTSNPVFNAIMRKTVTHEVDLFAISFIRTPRTEHPSGPEVYPAYYQSIVKNDKFPDDDIFNIPNGKQCLCLYADFAGGIKSTFDERLSFLTTDRQKGEYILSSYVRRVKTYEQYEEMINMYGKYFVSESQKQTISRIGAELYETKSGNAASDFTYPDTEGKMVSLSSFKGKVVLIDVWATWCAPCKQQIPHLKKLEEEMKGKDIVFLCVSVDEEKDKAKWLETIKKENLGGIHLFASGWSKITQDYKIKGIPRFMLFDKKGNIVTVEAPRPSDPALKALIEKELAK